MIDDGSAYRSQAMAPGVPSDDLVLGHAELVKRIAYHMVGRLPPSVDVDDLIQAGMIGLIEAAANFTSDRGANFSTYAGIRIRGAMLDELRKVDWTPRSVHRKAREVAEAVRKVENELGRDARDVEVAASMGLALEDYHHLLVDSLGARVFSLDQLEDESEIEAAAEGPLAEVEQADFREAIVEAIQTLPEREQLVMSLYYEQEMNLKEIGAVLNLTESRVCQIHGQALGRLRARLQV